MDTCVCFRLRRAARAITQFYESQLQRHGLRATQTPILGMLAGGAELGMAELSTKLGMDRTTLLRNLRPLERQGCIEVVRTGPRARVQVRITAAGKAALARLLPDWGTTQATVLGVLGTDRWSGLLADLEQAASQLSG